METAIPTMHEVAWANGLRDLGRTIQTDHRVRALKVFSNSLCAVLDTELVWKEALDFLLADPEVLDAVLVLWATGDDARAPIEITVTSLTDDDWYRLLVAAAGRALTDTTTFILTDWS